LQFSDEQSFTTRMLDRLDIDTYNVIDDALNSQGFKIIGDNVAAGTLTAKNLYLTDWTNLIAEARDPDSWPSAGVAGEWHTSNVRTNAYGLGDIEIDPTESYRASLKIKANGSNFVNAGLTFLVMDANKTGIGWKAIYVLPSVQGQEYVVAGKQLFDAWPNARYVKPYLFIDIPTGTTHPHTYGFKDIRLHRMDNGELIVDGSITADLLNVNAIDSNTGNIKDLHVDTLMIKDNAVTIPRGQYHGTWLQNQAANNWITVVEITEAWPDGIPLIINANAGFRISNLNGYITCESRLLIDNQVVDGHTLRDTPAFYGSHHFTYRHVVSNPNGDPISIKYQLKAYLDTGTYGQWEFDVQSRALTILGAKK